MCEYVWWVKDVYTSIENLCVCLIIKIKITDFLLKIVFWKNILSQPERGPMINYRKISYR